MERKNSIEEIVKEFDRNMKGGEIIALVVFDRDGRLIACAVQDEAAGEFLSVIGGGLLSMTEKVLDSMDMNPLDRTIIETTRGNILLENLGKEFGIILIASPGVSIGRARMMLKGVVQKLKGISGISL